MKKGLGMVHIYMGDGKGKTSAGIGNVIRALGRNLNIKIIQLFKDDTGEKFFFQKISKNFDLDYVQFDHIHPLFKDYNLKEKDELKNRLKHFLDQELKDFLKYDVVLIDEISSDIKNELIDENFIINLIKSKPKKTELILTGKEFSKTILNKADYVSEIKKIKHPYDQNILAREGIEF